MKLITPGSGVVVDIPEPFVPLYKTKGYTEVPKPKKPRKKSKK